MKSRLGAGSGKDSKSGAGKSNTQHDIVNWCTGCLGPKIKSPVGVASDAEMKFPWMVVGIIFLVIGVIFAFYGYAMITLTMSLIGFMAGFSIFFFLCCGIFHSVGMGDDPAAWAAIGVGILAAINFVVFLAFKWRSLGYVLVGVAGGVIFAIQLNGWVLHFAWNAIGGEIANYLPLILNLVFAILGGVMLFLECSREFVVILTTTMAGAYMAVWGACQVIMGNGKDSISTLIHPVVLFSGERWEKNPLVYVALGVVVIVAIFATYIQYKYTRHSTCCGLGAKDDDLGKMSSDGTKHPMSESDSRSPLMGREKTPGTGKMV
jgi:hypothetical protein